MIGRVWLSGAALMGALAAVVSVTGIYDLTLAADATTIDHPDYVWHPLSMSSGERRFITLIAVLVVITGGFVLQARLRRGRASRSFVAVAGVSCALGAYAGLLYAVATQPVVGANIGFGLIVLGAVPYACVAVFRGLRFARGRTSNMFNGATISGRSPTRR